MSSPLPSEPSSSQPSTTSPTSVGDLPYRIGPTPDKGLGVFATRFIPIGELIIAESRLFGPASTIEEIEAGVAALSEEDKVLFWSSGDGWAHCKYSKSADEYGIMRTNGVPCDTVLWGDGGHFPVISRVNHGCRPNVFWSWSTETDTMHLRATVNINEGEELIVTYIPLTQYRTLRKIALFTGFGFDCHCSACDPDNFGDESDTRRVRIQELSKKLKHAEEEHYHFSAMRYIKEMRRLQEEEGLNDLAQGQKDHQTGGTISVHCGDFEEARRQLGLAYAYRVLAYGPEGEFTQKLLGLHRTPQNYPRDGEPERVRKIPSICDRCGKEELGGFKGAKSKGGSCGECHCAIYCSKKCKIAHANQHRPTCALIRAGRAKSG